MKRRLLLVFGIGVPLGLIMLAIRVNLNMSDKEALRFFLITSLTLFVMVMAVTLASNFMFTRKLNKLGSLLANRKIDEFIEENQKLLASMKRKNIYREALVKLNLSAGYSRKNNYEKAREMLENVSPESIKGANKAVYFINKSYTYFKLGMNDEAVTVIKEGEQSIKSMEYHKVLGGNIAVLKVLEACAEKDSEKAKMLLSVAKNKWSKGLEKEDFDNLELAIKNIENNGKKEENNG